MPKDKKGRLSFIVFLNFINWLEDANLDNKLKVVHAFINNGDELDVVILSRLLRRVYPSKTEVLFLILLFYILKIFKFIIGRNKSYS